MLYNAVVRFLYFWCKMTGCKLEGVENLPKSGAIVTMANHSHFWDPFLLAVAWWPTKRPLCFMAKSEFFEKKLLGKLLRAVGAFPVNRGEADIASLRTSLTLLKEGQILGIFPEGTRNKNAAGSLLEFKRGATMIAYKAKATVVPVALINADNLFAFWRPRPKAIIAKPIVFAGESRPAKEVMEEYTEQIKSGIAGILAEAQPKA